MKTFYAVKQINQMKLKSYTFLLSVIPLIQSIDIILWHKNPRPILTSPFLTIYLAVNKLITDKT